MFFIKKGGQDQTNNVDTRVPAHGTGNANQAATVLSDLRKKKRDARHRLMLLLLASALVISLVLVAANVQSSGNTLTLRMANQATSLDLAQSLPISPYVLGSNVFPMSGTTARDARGKGFMSYAPQVVQGLRSAGIKLLRFPGGNWGEEHIPSPEQLNDFSNLLNQVGAEGFMQAQLSDPLHRTPASLAARAARAAQLVDYMNNPQSSQRDVHAPFHPIKYWSIGNEPDLLTNQETGRKYMVAEYTRAFIAYSLAMHEKDPSIQVFGPELSQYSANGEPGDQEGHPWMENFLQGVGAYQHAHPLPFQLLDGVTIHIYPFKDGEKNAHAILSNPRQWDQLVPSLHRLTLQTLGENLPIAVTEINTNPGSPPPPQNLSALWWAETLGALMNNGVKYVAFFSTEGVESPSPLFLQNSLAATGMLHTMQLFARLQSNLVPAQTTQDAVSIDATQNSQHTTVSLLFINRTNTDQEITVQGGGYFNLWHGATLTLPGYGMATLTLHRGGGDETLRFDN